jgi:hypothetical protein
MGWDCLCGTGLLKAHCPTPRWYMSEYGAAVELYRQGETEGLEEKPVPVLLRPPQIPYGLTWARTLTSAVRSRRLTWAMAGPRYHQLSKCPQSMFMCFVWFALQTAIISLNSVNQLIFVIVKCGVFFAVRTELFKPHCRTKFEDQGYDAFSTVSFVEHFKSSNIFIFDNVNCAGKFYHPSTELVCHQASKALTNGMADIQAM